MDPLADRGNMYSNMWKIYPKGSMHRIFIYMIFWFLWDQLVGKYTILFWIKKGVVTYKSHMDP